MSLDLDLSTVSGVETVESKKEGVDGEGSVSVSLKGDGKEKEEGEEGEEDSSEEEDEESSRWPNAVTFGPSALIISNYISVLKNTDSELKLRQSFNAKHYIYNLYSKMSERQQRKLHAGLVKTIWGTPTFSYEKPDRNIPEIVVEIGAFVVKEVLRRDQEEMSDCSVDLDSMPVTPKAKKSKRDIQRETKRKHDAQRKLDAMKRMEQTRQRQILYNLIHTGSGSGSGGMCVTHDHNYNYNCNYKYDCTCDYDCDYNYS